MKYAGGGIVRHLGLQNYKGAVPALAELIANAWDADASDVKVKIPLGCPITLGQTITIIDNGTGMSFNDCDTKYLVIGRNRRIAEQTDKTKNGRQLMAHKGLGKLAGFGIANIVEVKSVRAKKLTHFIMHFSEIDQLDQGEEYKPEMIADEVDTEKPDGTEIVLKNINLDNQVAKDQFLRSMASRFAVLSEQFKVIINGELLTKANIPLLVKFPSKTENTLDSDSGWGEATLSTGSEIKWWIGFTEKPIQIEGMHGISVITRGRISQDPWDFGLSSGVHNQWGLRYMTGEILADFLDEGFGKDSDLIITNRSAALWDNPRAKALYDWARQKIKELIEEYYKIKSKKTLEEIETKNPQITSKIDRFQERERKELRAAMEKLAEVPAIEPEKLVNVLEHVIDGYQDSTFTKMLEEMKKIPMNNTVEVINILKEFDILEAIRVHKIVSSRVSVITTFEDMILKGVPEKPDMHDHIMKYPWLLGIEYQAMFHEKSLEAILINEFNIQMEGEDKRKIPDFFCMRGAKGVLVIELKRPGEAVGNKELDQIAGYVDNLRHWANRGNPEAITGSKINAHDIHGYLIAYDYKEEPTVKSQIERLEKDGIHCCKWVDLLHKAEDDHRLYLEIVKSHAPKEDPRILEMEERGII